MFGREAIVDGDHWQVQFMREIDAKWFVRVEVADHPPAAMNEQQQWARNSVLLRVVEAKGNGAFNIPDDGDLTRRVLERMARCDHHLSRAVGADLIPFGPIEAFEIIQELPDVRSYERFCQALLRCCCDGLKWRNRLRKPKEVAT